MTLYGSLAARREPGTWLEETRPLCGAAGSSEDSHKYALSLCVTALGASILSSHTVRKTARPILIELRDQMRESVHLAVLEGIEVRAALAGNICRCTGYVKPVAAVLRAAQVMNE